ncbi:MAG: RluA family pseudouridine synthase [Clostridia bacterium]|nr:RluA family pseudouridine synthase [Clostridia bacterium]
MEIQERTVEAVGDGRRLDVLLAEAAGLTRSRATALIAEGLCTVDGKPAAKAGMLPRPGAAVLLIIPAPRPAEPQPEDIPVRILYQDGDIAVVDKPCGMVVHPAAGNEDGTLVNALLFALDSLSGIGGTLRPGIVHRLDKDTSGLLLVAKNDAAQLALSRQLQDRTMEKHYLALAEGHFSDPAGTVIAPIARDKKDRKRMAVDPAGREAVTEWRVLAEGARCTLLDVHILTGRTHQIRVHLRSLQHPVCGDPIYDHPHGLRVPRLMLHARSLQFTHPVTGERMRFVDPPPEAFLRGLRAGEIPESVIASIQRDQQ